MTLINIYRIFTLIVAFVVGKSLFSQQLNCDLIKMLHHDTNGRVVFFCSGEINVNLKKEKSFDFGLIDSAICFSFRKKELTIKPKDDLLYSIKIKDSSIFLLDANGAINLNQGHDSLSNIVIEDEFVSSRKIRKLSFLNVVYQKSKATKIEILELNRRVNLWVAYFDSRAEIKKITIDWLDTGSYLILNFSIGNYPYLLDYYDAIKKAGIALFYKFQTNNLSDVLIYEPLINEANNNQDIPSGSYPLLPKTANRILTIGYDKTGTIKKKSKKVLNCK